MNQNNCESEFLNMLPEIVFEIDSDFKINFLNQSFERILGYKTSEFLNKKITFEEIVVADDWGKIKNSFTSNFSGFQVSGNDYGVYKQNGEIVRLEIHNSHIKKRNKVIGLRCIAIDISEKAKKQDDLSSQVKHYREIFENSPIPYQSLDKNGIILDVNPAWEKTVGYRKPEIKGKSFTTIVRPEKHNYFSTIYNHFLKKGEIHDVQFEIISKSGLPLLVNYNGKVELQDGEIVKTHCVFNDITLQKKAEQTIIESELKFRDLNATKDKFFSIIAHDLKNPFNDLMGFTQLLALNINKYDKPKIEQFVKIIHQSSRLAYNLLENLLDWSRTQTGTFQFNPEKIEIFTLIHETIDLLESTAKNKNLHIYSELSTNLFAFADKNMVRTIIRNLISNAIKYTPINGIIKIQCFCLKDLFEISVTDNGVGIGEENIKKLFKIDTGYSTSGTEKEKGTGLGLILCKEFVERNGGKMSVRSKLNKGSTFTFTLPSVE